MVKRKKRLGRAPWVRIALVAGLAAGVLALSATEAAAPQERILRLLDASTGRTKATIMVELALSLGEQTRGLQGRLGLEPGRGMLFPYARAAPRAFWMKDVAFPIDLIYADGRGRVTEVLRKLPPCLGPAVSCPTYPSRYPAQYVLELAAGQADALNIRLDDRLELSPP